MLLITRRTDEAIVINGEIIVKVVEVRGNRVKLGFDFPTGSTVYRKELFDKIQEENRAAALTGNSASDVLKALPTATLNKLPALPSPTPSKEETHANIDRNSGDSDD